MILITTTSKKKYWIQDYNVLKDMYVMTKQVKKGGKQTIMIPKEQVAEVVLFDNDSAIDKPVQVKVK
jgi:hypothetical protein